MYIYNLGQSLTLLTGAPAPGTAAVYLLSSEELDRNPQLPAVACGQFLQCFQRIGYDEIVRLFRRGHSVRYRRVVYDRRRRSRSDRRRRIAVAVQRKENSSRDDLPAIGRDAREFAI